MNRFTKYGWFQLVCALIVMAVFGVCVGLALGINGWIAGLSYVVAIWMFMYGYSRGRHPEKHYNKNGMDEMLKTEKEIKNLQEDMKHF